MRLRLAIALAAACLLAGPASQAQNTYPAQFFDAYTWSMSHPDFGGWSGLEVSADGTGFTAVSDRANIVQGRFVRDDTGRITGIEAGEITPIRHIDGTPLPRYHDDSEGLAIGPDGRMYLSFEAVHRVVAYPDTRASRSETLPKHPDFKGMINNSSLEALAIDQNGALYTIPERSGGVTRPFPVYRLKSTRWDIPFGIRRNDGMLITGADFGPDGMLYVLERELHGFFGFSSRVRRFNPAATGTQAGETLLETPPGRHDNLEGLAVWRDDAGRIRLTMISDDNFRFFQTTHFVEYTLDR
ncbi:MAG: hypothetical protein CR993_05715 [Rhodobacterales bacterium]|nr:MAG: hypothetical protein CR993_05715 [Rhodobacterales bacterium]